MYKPDVLGYVPKNVKSETLVGAMKEDEKKYIDDQKFRVHVIINLITLLWNEINGGKTDLYFRSYYGGGAIGMIGDIKNLAKTNNPEFFIKISNREDSLKDPDNMILLVSYESINIFTILCDTHEKLVKFVDSTKCVMTIYNIMIKYIHKLINNELAVEDKEMIFNIAVDHGSLQDEEGFSESKFDRLLSEDEDDSYKALLITTIANSSEFINRIVNESDYTDEQWKKSKRLLNKGAVLYRIIVSNENLKSKEILKETGWY